MRIAQYVLLALTLAFIVSAVVTQWSALTHVARTTTLDWWWIVAGSALVLLTHAALIQAWRMLLSGWDVAPPFWTSARIWSSANLGKYLPGKVWSIGALGVLAGREGVSGVAAASAAILSTLLNIGAGIGIAATAGSRVLSTVSPLVGRMALVCAVLFAAGVVLLPRLLPPVVTWIARRRGLPAVDRRLSPGVLWAVTAINALSWVGYGLAFAAFSRGVTPQVAGAAAAFITVYTASYVWGYLVLFAPGGLGFRELAIVALMVAMGMATRPDATMLALASRVWITVLEITPGLIALLLTPGLRRSGATRAG